MTDNMTDEQVLEGLKDICKRLGKVYADAVFVQNPPPWHEEEFAQIIGKVRAVAQLPFQTNPVRHDAAFMEVMHAAAFEGFDDRIRAIATSADSESGGRA